MGSERRLRLFIYARIVVTSLFLVTSLLLEYQDSYSGLERFQPGVVMLIVFSFLFSVISLLFVKKLKFNEFLANLQVIWDLLFVSVLVLFTGGITSPYSFLYLLSILIAGMLLGRRQALYTASLCGILYGTILDFQYFGYLSSIGLSREVAQQAGPMQLFYTITFNLIVFGLTAFITGLLAERARLSEEALQRSSIDYFELAQLNSAIVAHSESGIITTTVSGRIRVFNPYAETLVGLSQSEAYDREIAAVFPLLGGLSVVHNDSGKREFDFHSADGTVLTLGYRIAPFSDNEGQMIGYIINFRDISNIRRMEAALKKADRLAALGELSARMAHEIRNPLAALCGSVQLLSSSSQVSDHDVRLLEIVTREAERLDVLISEFLLYARPASPQLERIALRRYIDEEFLFLSNDPHFTKITLVNQVIETAEISVDPDQFHQVIVNLFRNSADAMPDGGTLFVESFSSSAAVKLSITDTGTGMSENAVQHLFEPFWTTKPMGTGLGLAISYRIIEAHGGNLVVESPASGGCRFVITLPVP
jgi:two-component system sensor histidine kinase PilS (NtrC family)